VNSTLINSLFGSTAKRLIAVTGESCATDLPEESDACTRRKELKAIDELAHAPIEQQAQITTSFSSKVQK